MPAHSNLQQGNRLLLLTSLVCSVSLLISVSDGESLEPFDDSPSVIEFRHCTISYYRAPEHAWPPSDMLDPYDCFAKDNRGELLILPTDVEYFSEVARAEMRGYRLKTKKGNPILIYQPSPTRRWQYRTDCHGLTFLNGEYWLCNEEVQTILDDDNWSMVDERHVQRGDVAIYRNPNGAVIHSARVIECDAKGHVMVDSKNGMSREERRIWAEKVRLH